MSTLLKHDNIIILMRLFDIHEAVLIISTNIKRDLVIFNSQSEIVPQLLKQNARRDDDLVTGILSSYY